MAIESTPCFAHWYPTRQKDYGRCYKYTVRVLDVRKKTARIEAVRRDGTRVKRFVKLERLMPGKHWQEY